MVEHDNPNVDSAELERFESLAHRWWDPDGEFKPLHDINNVRLNYINQCAPVSDKTVLDAGCGGGILTESLARLGAIVTGIDPAQRSLGVARLHAIETGVADQITYMQTTAEEMVSAHENSFDVVVCLEILEHVPNYRSTINALARLVKPGGDVVISTINRSLTAFCLAIVGAEYVLNLLPRGTHRYDKLLRPSEVAAAMRSSGLTVVDTSGYSYQPLTGEASMTSRVSVNYLIHAQKLE